MKAVRYVPKDAARVTLVVAETDEVVVVEAEGFETKCPFAIARLDLNPNVERAAARKPAPKGEQDGEGAKTTTPKEDE